MTKKFRQVPVRKGQEIETEIMDLAHGGASVAKHDTFTLFIPYGVPGDKVKARITDVKRNFANAEIEAVITPSALRSMPMCPYFGQCGGCQWQNVTYNSQLEFKVKSITSSLKKITGVTVEKLEIKGYENPFSYRDRSQYKLAQGEDTARMGFYKAGSHDVIDVQKCLIQKEAINHVMAGAREFLAANKNQSLSIYDQSRARGALRYFAVRVNSAGECLFAIITYEDARNDSIEKFAKHMKENFPMIKGVVMNVNALTGSRIFGSREYVLAGEGVISETVKGVEFELGAETFFQVNTERLNDILDFIDANIPEGDSVVDLYAGVGALSLPLHRKIRELKAVDVYYKSIDSFRKAAQTGKIPNVEIIKATAEDAAEEVIKEGKTGTVIVDPPRKGLNKRVMDAIKKKKVKNVIYISCDPPTFARDLKELGDLYIIKKINAVDMFPQTYHVETLCTLGLK